jgi:hypothetical protein
MLDCIGLIQHHIGRLDGELAAFGHGVPGIHHQVHQHLFHLCWIHLYFPEIVGQKRFHFNVFPEEAIEHANGLLHHPVQIHDLRSERLFAAEGQELGHKGCSPFPRLPDLLQVAPGLLVLPEEG